MTLHTADQATFKHWSNDNASERKWSQVELADRLALGGQMDMQV